MSEHFESTKQLHSPGLPGVSQKEGCGRHTLNASIAERLIFIDALGSTALCIKHDNRSTLARLNEGVVGKFRKPVDVKAMYSPPAEDAFKGVLRFAS